LEESEHGSAPTLPKAALAYARRGVPVFPCEPGAKRPLTRNGHWDATTDPRIIERWWKRWPSANVGVPTGKKSGVVVLDVDDGGLESLAKLERAGAAAPKTARARTGGGGIHVFFRYPRGTEIRNSAGLLGPGLDVRGEGGYVVVPPSRTQSSYQWVDRSPLAEASWLIEHLTESDEATLF
jgi:Bifunctional DNA primase/polymerase, N-terminal